MSSSSDNVHYYDSQTTNRQHCLTTWPYGKIMCPSNSHDVGVLKCAYNKDMQCSSFNGFFIPEVFSDLTLGSNDGTWIGLVDSRYRKLYTWTDGNMLIYTNWRAEPTDMTSPCVQDDQSRGFKWQESACSNTARVICKKPEGIVCVVFFIF